MGRSLSPSASLSSASDASHKEHSTAVDQKSTRARTGAYASVTPSRGPFAGSYHAFLTCATDTPSIQDETVYLYSPDGPLQVVGATIQEGMVYDSYGNFLGTLNPTDSQIYNSNNNAIGYVFSPA